MKKVFLFILLSFLLSGEAFAQCYSIVKATPLVCDFWSTSNFFNIGTTVTAKTTGGVVCGFKKITQIGGLLIHVVGDDPTTYVKDGASVGDTIIFYTNRISRCGCILTKNSVVWFPLSSKYVQFKFLGDIDCNNVLNNRDVDLLQDYLFNNMSIKDTSIADLDGDCKIDIFDLLNLNSFVKISKWKTQLDYCGGQSCKQ